MLTISAQFCNSQSIKQEAIHWDLISDSERDQLARFELQALTFHRIYKESLELDRRYSEKPEKLHRR